MRAVAVCVPYTLPGCSPVEVAPPHTQTAAPRMLTPMKEEGRGGEGGDEGKGDEWRNLNSHFKTTTHTPTCLHHHYIMATGACTDLQPLVSC